MHTQEVFYASLPCVYIVQRGILVSFSFHVKLIWKHDCCCYSCRFRLVVWTAVAVLVGLKAEDQMFFLYPEHTTSNRIPAR